MVLDNERSGSSTRSQDSLRRSCRLMDWQCKTARLFWHTDPMPTSLTEPDANKRRIIDLRSDTVTRPTTAMREVMVAAEVGDDVWGDDPTVTRLEQTTADLLNKEAAVYVPSGTQSNLCALMAHCQRGDEYIVGENAHTYTYEAGGAAVLGSIQPQTVPTSPQGELDLVRIESSIKPVDDHFANTKLICLENTHDGHPLSLSYQAQVADIASEHGLALHLDGARLWNAAVALEVDPAGIAAPFDSVSVCLSKGLGAPVGSVLVGSAPVIRRARKWRKMLGGGMRQAGILAAAGLYAIENNRARLVEDHNKARRLATGISEIDGASVSDHATNMVFANFTGDGIAIESAAAERGLIVRVNDGNCRMVTHLDINDEDIDVVLETLRSAISKSR